MNTSAELSLTVVIQVGSMSGPCCILMAQHRIVRSVLPVLTM